VHPDSHPVALVPESHPVMDAAQPAAQEVPATQQSPTPQEQEQLQSQASSSSSGAPCQPPAPADEAPSASGQRPGSGGGAWSAGRSSAAQAHLEREQLLLQAVDEVEVTSQAAHNFPNPTRFVDMLGAAERASVARPCGIFHTPMTFLRGGLVGVRCRQQEGAGQV
jgi:hypothetical protein